MGSNASRTASPIKVTRVRVKTRAVTVEMTIHGAVLRLLTPCFKSYPQLGVGGGNPYPKKSSAVIEEIAAAMVKGAKVTKVEITFGSKCLKIIRMGPAPITFAAAM